jgi:hypothetical protein
MNQGKLRSETVVRLMQCDKVTEAISLIDEADHSLRDARLSANARRSFWDGLSEDIASSRPILIRKQSSSAFSAAVAIAKAAIVQHQSNIGKA